MKKIILSTILSLFAIAAMAQVRPTFIVSAGYQGANMNVNDKENDNKMKSGFRVGATADFPVYNFGTGELSVQAGLYYSTKGVKRENYAINLGYVDLPILANVRFGVTPDFNVFLNGGGYLAYGVHSSATVKKTGDDLIDGISAGLAKFYDNAFKKDGIYQPFDAGIQVGAGAEYKRIQLSVGGQFGLVNLVNTNNKAMVHTPKTTNNTMFVTLGYRF